MVALLDRARNMPFGSQAGAVTVVAVLVLIIMDIRNPDPAGLWLTPDQRGRLAYEDRRFADAADLFRDPMWKGTAEYAAGRYVEAAETFGRIPSAVGFFNRGVAFLKGREYAKAITAFKQAVADAPEWTEAMENLELSRYILEYLEATREQSSLGEQALGADDVRYDKQSEGGTEMVINQDSGIEMQSAEKWMRSVDTETGEFLRSRFELEARLRETPE